MEPGESQWQLFVVDFSHLKKGRLLKMKNEKYKNEDIFSVCGDPKKGAEEVKPPKLVRNRKD